MRTLLAALLLSCLWAMDASAQCAPAPDSPYFFRNLSEKRAEAKIAEDREVYESQLSETFVTRAPDGKPLTKADFITREISAKPAAAGRRFYAISNYTLLEHRKGYTVASYLLTEGTTGNGETHASEAQMREVYEVTDGKWRLASVEVVKPADTLSHATP